MNYLTKFRCTDTWRNGKRVQGAQGYAYIVYRSAFWGTWSVYKSKVHTDGFLEISASAKASEITSTMSLQWVRAPFVLLFVNTCCLCHSFGSKCSSTFLVLPARRLSSNLDREKSLDVRFVRWTEQKNLLLFAGKRVNSAWTCQNTI